MATNSQILSRDAAVCAALIQSDSLGWCFLSDSEDLPCCCSTEFAVQWQVDLAVAEAAAISRVPAVRIREALGRYGIDPACNATRVIRSDGLQLDVFASQVVLVNGTRIGQLLCFRTATESGIVETVLREVAHAQQRLLVLSPRENEILMLVYRGQTNKAISTVAKISEKTVEKHRARIMQKLRLDSTSSLYRLVARAKLIADIEEEAALENGPRQTPGNSSLPTPHFLRSSNRVPQL